MNSGILPTQAACKINSLCYLYWALNHEHQLFLVFEVKLQVYWGHRGSTGVFFFFSRIHRFCGSAGQFAPLVQKVNESHAFLYLLQGLAQQLVNICWYDLLQDSRVTVAEAMLSTSQGNRKKVLFPTNIISESLENILECMSLHSKRDRA